jgi:hypothetical protein
MPARTKRQAKRSSRYDQKDNDEGRGKLDPMTKVGQLIQFADQPRKRSKEKGDTAAELRGDRKHWNWRQPKRPPKGMQSGP